MRKSLYLAIAGALAACDGDAATDAGIDAGPEVCEYDPGTPVRISEAQASAARTACTFARGAMPWETIGEEFPIGADIPIDHFIILMQENRSFDHYFGVMPDEEGREIEGIPEGATNPDEDGTPIAAFHTDDYCIRDVAHGWNSSHIQFNDGANDGFVTTNNPNGARAMGYLDQSDLPFYWDLARTFAMSDHHHCSVMGPTWVNRYYFLSGTSFGLTSNDPLPRERVPAEGDHVIFEQLDRACVSWAVFYEAVPFVFGAYPHYALRPPGRAHIREFEEFYAALDEGTLPSVSYIDPTWDFSAGVDATDEHPPANPQRGQAWVREIVEHVMASDYWPRTAIIITYDEHGGFYDHVPPPEACPPGDLPPDLAATDVQADFDHTGFRVPLLVVSPYSRPGYVSDRNTELSSVLRLLQARFQLPAMSNRDANAWPLLDMFDFSSPALLEPPALAEAPVNEAQVEACRAEFE